MAKRIVKKIFNDDGRKVILYVIETNRLLGFIPTKWRLVSYVETPDELFTKKIRRKAVFYSFQEACEFVGGEVTEIVEQEIAL